ncbi:MAG: ABC transporter ATP-binding protein [Candidatus Methylacidiphilales bacterium]
MIEVNALFKKYSGFEAVSGISFNVDKGEIVGFLGPNGAGKSSTMRMLTGYLPPSSGDIRIAGMDVLNHSIQIRKKIGYMPENVPLYTDMTVKDFLSYRAALKGVSSRNVRSRVSDCMQKCGLSDVSKKMIGNLSRGYRQRVGLADALVHDPELLILDEPTAGLDPNQIRSVRDLIKELGKSHTILLSTHILPEVEMVCSRAIIINRGKIEASDTLENLSRRVRSGALHLEIKSEKSAAVEKLKALADVSEVTALSELDGWVRLECLSVPGTDSRCAVDELIKKQNWPLREFHYEKAKLEDVFVELTQE